MYACYVPRANECGDVLIYPRNSSPVNHLPQQVSIQQRVYTLVKIRGCRIESFEFVRNERKGINPAKFEHAPVYSYLVTCPLRTR